MAVYTQLNANDTAALLAAYTLAPDSVITPLAGGISNSSFRISTATGDYIASLFEHDDPSAEIAALAGWLDYLRAQRLGVPTLLKNKAGGLTITLQGKTVGVQPWLHGTPPTHLTPTLAQQGGALLKRLHLLGQTYPAFGMNRRISISLPALAAALQTSAQELFPQHASRPLPDTTGLPHGIIHGDFFADNLLCDGGKITTVLDWFFARYDAQLFDLAMALNAWCFHTGFFDHSIAKAFMQGYGRIAATEQARLPAMGWLAAWRIVLYRLWCGRTPAIVGQVKDPRAYSAVLDFWLTATPELFNAG